MREVRGEVNMKLSVKSLIAMFVAVLSMGVFFYTTQAAPVDTTPDCDKYAVVYCGTKNRAAMVDAMTNGDGRNSAANIRNIFSQFGISVNDVKNANFVDGVVYQNGEVKVGGKVVAKNAQTYIRTLGGKGSTSRMGSAQAAKVALNNKGQFLFAVMTPCGNPVTGKNVVPEPPKPVAKCDSLTATKIDRDTRKFTVAATAKNGAKITKYVYDFGDGKTKESTSNTVSHTYAKAGTYTVTAKVHFTIDGKSTSSTCKTEVTIKPEAPKPVAKCDSLTADKISRTEYSFTTAATAENGAEITKYVYDFGDGNTKTETGTTVTHEYAKEGTYTVEVEVHFTINGKPTSSTCETKVTVEPKEEPKVPGVSIEKTVNDKEYAVVEVGTPFNYELVVTNTGEVTLEDVVVTDEAPEGITFTETDKGSIVDNSLSYTIASLAVGGSETINITAVMEEAVEGRVDNTACVETPTVPGGNPDDCDDATVETKVEVCDLTTGTIVKVTAEEAKDERYTTDLSKCDDVVVCDLETGETATIKKSELDDERYTTDLSKCDEEEVKEVKVCDTKTGDIIMVDESKADDERYAGVNDEACNPPVKGEVTELPKTGLVQTLSSFMGISSLAAATAYYISSRRS